jgi:hypothetical protein
MSRLTIKLGKPNTVGTQRSRAAIKEFLARVGPVVEHLLAGGVPLSQPEIFKARGSVFERNDVRRTLMRLAVTDRLVLVGTKYTSRQLSPKPTRRVRSMAWEHAVVRGRSAWRIKLLGAGSQSTRDCSEWRSR